MYASELAKIRYAKSNWIIAVVVTLGVATTALITVFSGQFIDALTSLDDSGQTAGLSGELGVAGFGHAAMQWATVNIIGSSGGSVSISVIGMLIFGMLNVTSEFRYGSMATTLLARPSRPRATLAKAGAVATTAAAISLALVALTACLLAVGLAVYDVPTAIAIGPLLVNWGLQVAALVMIALVGMGVGLIVRSQVAALIIVFAWVFAESLVRSLSAVLISGISPANFLPLGLGTDVNHQTAVFGDGAIASLTPAVALVTLLGWVIVLVGSGTLTLHRRDVPA